MAKVPLDPVARESQSSTPDRVAALRELFPEAACEGRVDLDKLRLVLGEAVDDRPERYAFYWFGKRDASRILAEPSRATLNLGRTDLLVCRDNALDDGTAANLALQCRLKVI